MALDFPQYIYFLDDHTAHALHNVVFPQEERIPLASEDEEDDEEIESSDSEDGAPEDERLQELRQRLATKVNIEVIYNARVPTSFKKRLNNFVKSNCPIAHAVFVYVDLKSSLK